jgi:hypothetical protein
MKRFAVILGLILISLLAFGAVQYIGNQTHTDSDSTANRMICLRVQNTVGTGNITELGFYTLGVGTGNIRVGVYADSAGVPGALISDAGVLACSGAAWNSLTGLSISVTNNAYYWLVFIADTAFYWGTEAGGAMTSGYKAQTYGALPDPFGTQDVTDYTYDPMIRAGVETAGGWKNMPAAFHAIIWRPMIP